MYDAKCAIHFQAWVRTCCSSARSDLWTNQGGDTLKQLIFNFFNSKIAKAAADSGIPILGTLSSIIALAFGYATKLEGIVLYVFIAVMFAIIATVLFFMYLTFSKKYDYHPRPDFKTNYKPDYNSKNFNSSRKGVGTIIKSFIVVFVFCVTLGVLNHFFNVFQMFNNGLSFVEGLVTGLLGNPVIDTVVDMILGAID